MFLAYNLCLFLILNVQTVNAFQFTNCTEKPLLILENGIAQMGCTTDGWFGYCTLINNKASKSCTIEINRHNYATKHSDCDLDQRIKFTGDASKKTCIFTIGGVQNSGV